SVKVNDNTFDSAQILPALAVDPISGYVAISFYSARNDPGFGPGDRDTRPNTDVEMFAAVSTDGGVSFSSNVQVASGPSSASIAGHNSFTDFGDYTGLAFYNNVFYPAWADNSTSLVGNPDPNSFDIATAKVSISFLNAVVNNFAVPEGQPIGGVIATFTNAL